MPSPLLRGAAEAVKQGAATGLFNVAPQLSQAVMSNMGNSSRLTYGKHSGPTGYGGYKFPVIPYGVPTTVIPVPFPLTRAPVNASAVVTEQFELVIVFFLALVVWMMPTLCINKRICCQCFRTFMSRRLGSYFIIGLIMNLSVISIVIAMAPHVDANSLFFTAVKLIEKVTDQLEKALIQLGALACMVLLWLFRKKIATILGFDHQVIRASLRDLLTGFSMKRFRAIEISLWKAEGLPVGFKSNTLFTRVTLGYNEAQHTRPHDGQRDNFLIKERVQMNYDPEDDTQRMSIVIKMQEVIGQSINNLLPAAGAVVGAVGGLASPLGPTTGAAVGVVTGTGAANSVGAEIARVDLSSIMMNRMRDRFHKDEAPNPSSERPSTRTQNVMGVRWIEDYFQKVDLLPQGFLWVRIADISDA